MEVDPPASTANGTGAVISCAPHSPFSTNEDTHTPPVDFELDTEQIKQILTFGKDLQKLFNQLSANTPQPVLKALLQDSFSLLAYTNPRSSPVSYLLDPLQREPVAATLNSAILGMHEHILIL